MRGVHTTHLLASVIAGFAAAICIASANYVINEYLDRDFDRHHPTKSLRTAVQRVMSGRLVCLEWAGLVAIGLFSAWLGNKVMFAVAIIFALQGIVYNVPPLRSKEKAYLDVISESINNPLRLMIGWSMIDPLSLPPGSIILCYWLGGAFLMSAKRLSEYREITAAHGAKLLVLYRASFAGYSERALLASCFFYALFSISFLSIFLVKYRIEYILTLPIVATLFVLYLMISLAPGSSAQKPEKLYREKSLIAVTIALAVTFALTSLIHVPALASFANQHYIMLP